MYIFPYALVILNFASEVFIYINIEPQILNLPTGHPTHSVRILLPYYIRSQMLRRNDPEISP